MSIPPFQPLPVVMTTKEVAELLRVEIRTVERYVYAHELVAIRIGRKRRFRCSDVINFLDGRPTSIRAGKHRQPRRVAR